MTTVPPPVPVAPSTLPMLGGAAIRALVAWADAVAALAEVFGAYRPQPLRTGLAAGGADVLVMPAALGGVAGVKLVAVQPANAARREPVIQGIYVLIDGERGRPVALLDGAALTLLRTPAASVLATRHLARRDARTLAVFGAGPQGLAHLAAFRACRPELEPVVVARRPVPGERLVPAAAGSAADVICTCTSSPEPVVVTDAVRAGAHLNAVGVYRPERRELDGALVRRATVVVDDRVAAAEEAGELIQAVRDGWSWDRVAGDLADVVAGRVARRDDREVTVFKSVGLAVEDLAVARLAAQRAGLLAVS